MASIGQASFFLHPAEAYHGDLGMVDRLDVALIISNSGETEEVIRLMPFFQKEKISVIALTGNLNSYLAAKANIVLDIGVEHEACHHNLVPTCSTTCTLVMGDALAMALADEKGFQPEDFARYHPGGRLGRKLLCRVIDVMHKDKLPRCLPSDSFRRVIECITSGRLGLVLIMNGDSLEGIVTDGDIRRSFEANDDCRGLKAYQIMTPNPIQVDPDMLLSNAELIMLDRRISALVVVEKGILKGVVQIYNNI
jgi:arabinose-5-phosphate isomerase